MPDQIEHVIVLMLENNSFDRMLGSLPGVDGINPARLNSNPDFPSGLPVSERSTTASTMPLDPEHDLDDVLDQIDGPCQGFVRDFAQHFPQSAPDNRSEIMAFYEPGALPVLHTLAQSFAICDRWFSSLPGPTWPNRFFVHSGTSLGHVTMPGGIFHPDIHCYNQETVYDQLQKNGISWSIYYGDFPQSIVMTHQWLYPTHYHPMQDFFADAQKPAAEFPQYVFIEPTYFGADQNDQHPPSDITRGEALIARVYNAIRGKPDLWGNCLFVLLYDEHGGFYDHVEPGPAVPPDFHTKEFAFDKYGVRVPAVLISPWIEAKPIHDVFDHTSLLKYVTDKWKLGPLGNRVAQANSFADHLTVIQSPRTDTPAQIPVPELASNPVTGDLNVHQQSLVGFSRFLESKIASEAGATDDVLREIGSRLVQSMRGAGQHAEVAMARLERFFNLQKSAPAKTLTAG
jgi:phospholipase C